MSPKPASRATSPIWLPVDLQQRTRPRTRGRSAAAHWRVDAQLPRDRVPPVRRSGVGRRPTYPIAAPAKDLDGWAGIPRKGWRVRMLYQRWIADSRKQEVTTFWDQASTPRDDQPKKYLVGPTAITVALFDEPTIVDGSISLHYTRPFAAEDSIQEKLRKSAYIVLSRMLSRLDPSELEDYTEYTDGNEIDFGHNYVLESLSQIGALAKDPDSFLANNPDLGDPERMELLQSLEQLCWPGLVVDGQHRLYGAAHSTNEVLLPVVAIPQSPWMEQIYQFVVINEKAQRSTHLFSPTSLVVH